MLKEQLGKDIFIILKKETNTTKYFQIKHKTKIKISINLENNIVVYTKVRSEKYLKFYIGWIIFHKELKVKHIGKVILNNEQLNLIKDQLDPNIVLYEHQHDAGLRPLGLSALGQGVRRRPSTRPAQT
jgi:hypothetical protein